MIFYTSICKCFILSVFHKYLKIDIFFLNPEKNDYIQFSLKVKVGVLHQVQQ